MPLLDSLEQGAGIPADERAFREMNESIPMQSAGAPPRLGELFGVFFRISALTVGGGYVMLPLMKREVVENKAWLSLDEMVDYYALGQSIPGIIAVNTATLTGYRKRGLPGALFAAAGMIAPSLIVITLIAAFLVPYFDRPVVQKAFAGIRAAVTAMIGMAVWEIGRKAARTWPKLLIAGASFVLVAAFRLSPIPVIVAGAALGLTFFRKGKEAP